MPGFSPPMHLKGDPAKSLKATLKKHKLEDILPEVERWLDSEPGSPGSLKKHFLATFAAKEGDQPVDYYEVDLKDSTTWGDLDPSMPMPSDQFFLDLFKAIKADEKRNAKRSSYEF